MVRNGQLYRLVNSCYKDKLYAFNTSIYVIVISYFRVLKMKYIYHVFVCTIHVDL